MTLFPHADSTSHAPALSSDLLAIIVAVVAFCVSGIFLLFLVPDRTRQTQADTPIFTELPESIRPSAMDHNATSPDVAPETLAPAARHLPVEREGLTQFIAVEDIVAVHANAHYTYVFNGYGKLFCPLAIGEVEARLDKDHFIRVHRSHIINVNRVIGYRRSGDNELVELAAEEHYAVPVSRSRIGALKMRINAMSERIRPSPEPAAHFAPQ